MSVAAEFAAFCYAHPLWFGGEIMRRRRTADQKRLRLAIQEHRHVVTYSGHSVGKSDELAAIALEWIYTHPGTRVIFGGPTYKTVRSGIFKAFRIAWRALDQSLRDRGFPGLGGKLLEDALIVDDGWDARIVAPDNPDALQGARGKTVFIVLDEAQGIRATFYDPLESLMTATASRFVQSGNPLYAIGKFRDAAHDPSTWHAVPISCFEHPNVKLGREVIPGAVTREWIAERLKEYGSEDDDRYIARVKGQFPKGGSPLQVISLALLEEADKGTVGVDEDPRIGVDLSRSEEGDPNVLSYYDRTRTLASQDEWFEDDSEKTVYRIEEAVRELGVKPENVKVDVGGLGGPIFDRLRGLGYNVDGVDFGAGPEYDWQEYTGETTQFLNRRAELYWIMRELLRRRLICIPRKFELVWRELLAVNKKQNPNDSGKLRLESKLEVRKKLGGSPDHADSSVVALSNVGQTSPTVFRV